MKDYKDRMISDEELDNISGGVSNNAKGLIVNRGTSLCYLLEDGSLHEVNFLPRGTVLLYMNDFKFFKNEKWIYVDTVKQGSGWIPERVVSEYQ